MEGLDRLAEALVIPDRDHMRAVGDRYYKDGVLAFLAKTSCFLLLFIWVRWTLPRFRFDQLMALGWKVMLPLALANVLVTGTFVSLGVDLW